MFYVFYFLKQFCLSGVIFLNYLIKYNHGKKFRIYNFASQLFADIGISFDRTIICPLR
jgi:hypothetical protein